MGGENELLVLDFNHSHLLMGKWRSHLSQSPTGAIEPIVRHAQLHKLDQHFRAV